MKPYNSGGHSAYQDRVLAQLRKYYPDAVSSLPASTWAVMEKFWSLDLSDLDSLMADRYSDFGPAPRLPSDMLRSILLSVEFKVTSYTKWAADLKENHLHAILSGFSVGDTPGVGTFYDFQSRLWMSDKDNLSDPVHPPKEKPKKPDKKGEKAPPVEKVTVKELLEQFELHPPKDMTPCKRLYDIFKGLFLERSVQDRLVSLASLSLAGDGTPVYTAAKERKKRTCRCLEKGIRDCTCDRIYRQPETVSVKGGGFPPCSGFICERKQISDTIFTLDFMDVCLVLAGECFIHAVFHKVTKKAHFRAKMLSEKPYICRLQNSIRNGMDVRFPTGHW